MSNTKGKATKFAALAAAAAILIGTASSAGAFSFGAPNESVAGQSSTVGSYGGYARAWVTYATAYVTAPQVSSGSVGQTSSAPVTADAAQTPVVVVKRTPGSPTPTVQIDVPEKIEVPNVARMEPLSTAAIEQVETELIELPPVDGIAAKAALLALLQTFEVGAIATVTSAETTTLAALDYARAQATLAFGDTETPEEAAMLAQIDAARAETVDTFAQAKATLVAKFAEAQAAVQAMDPAEFNDADAVEIVTLLTEASAFAAQKFAEAQAAMAAAMAFFV